MDLKVYLAGLVEMVDRAMDDFLPSAVESPETIHAAMRYSVFAGGKRLRPALCLAAAEACGGEISAALPAACAVELMHTYSLVHDDLPCMDDDDLRRGRPTCHMVYGEGMAVLCGDALLTEAFVVLAQAKATPRFSVGDMIAELAAAGSSRKLIGGQVLDLEAEGEALTLVDIESIHLAKTAALLTSSVCLGAMSANAEQESLDALKTFGRALGLAFQVIDDVLDVTQTTETLGKTAGKDVAMTKATYPAIIGSQRSRMEAQRLTGVALQALEIFGKNGLRLHQIAESMLVRVF